MKGVFAHAVAKEAKAHRTEMSMSQKSLENTTSENVITLIEETVAFVDHLAKPFMAMFMAMAAVDIYCTIRCLSLAVHCV